MIRNPFKRKEKPANIAGASKVIANVNALIEIEALKVKGPVFHIYREVLIGNKHNIIKNLFFYARLNELLTENETIFIKCIEDDKLLAVHNNSDGTVFI